MVEKIIEIMDPKGFVVFHDDAFSLGIGGIRLIEGVDLMETKLLAESMSQKLHMLNLPMSGAKGGINSDSIQDFYTFIYKIKKLISGKGDIQFITGPDMGTSEEEYYIALEKSDLSEYIRPGLLSSPSEYYHSLPLDNVVTALGALVCCEELVRRDKDKDPLVNKSFVIEGFGKVGTGIASIIKGRSKLVALSTRYGMIRADEGFNIDNILEMQSRYGDKFIFEMGREVYPTENLFEVPTDFLIPGARTHVIDEQIAKKIIKVRPIIVPVSNAPYTKAGISKLENSGIICFPDFVASAGAVIAAMAEFAGLTTEDQALAVVREVQQIQTRELLREGKACGIPTSLYRLAKDRVKVNRDMLVETVELNLSIQEIAHNFMKEFNLNHIK